MSLNFVAIDFETANPSRASACAIGLTEIKDGALSKTKSLLFRPPVGFDEFSGWNIAIHGITPSTVAGEPRFAELWPEILDFIGGQIIVAHNASFDMSVLRSTLRASDLDWPEYSFACTMAMSRQMFDITSHGLSHVAHKIGISWDEDRHHDALYDSEICADIAVAMSRIREQEDISGLLHSLGLSKGQLYRDGWETCHVNHYSADSLHHTRIKLSASEIEINAHADVSHPLYGKQVVFTGALHSMSRNDAWVELGKIGAIPSENVTKATNVIVVGQQDISRLKPGVVHSTKFQKAEKLKDSGQDIEVIAERDFLAYMEPVRGSRN